jgi:tRNA threonylcarbamoyladenosine biosynthesis protein TsaB
LQKTTHDTIFTAVDARMDEIYWAVYQRDAENVAQLLGIEKVQPAAQIDRHRLFYSNSLLTLHAYYT